MLALPLDSLAATGALAREMARQLLPGDVVLLRGTIGAGKTTFTAALAQALGSAEPVRSPTYTIAHSYELAAGGTLSHLDLYRQTGVADAASWGDLEPYFDATYVCVEWPEGALPWISSPTWTIELEHLEGDLRAAWVVAPDLARARALAGAVAQAS